MKSKELYDKIVYYYDLFPNDLNLVELIEKDEFSTESKITKWKSWGPNDNKVVYGKQKLIDNTNDDPNDSKFDSFIITTIKDAILECSSNYSNKYSIDIGNLTPLSISKYFEGKGMGPHVDSYSETPKEILSIVLYLNDDYEGGELYFKNQNIKVKPEAGSLIAFPSVDPYFHESLPVSFGIKYISPGFWIKY
jgi:predicted 2-oxoglutarate/Fe(II)-dependent dioxygenase YbiX